MAGGRGAGDFRAGASRRTVPLRQPGKLRQVGVAMKAEKTAVVKPQAQTTHKQLQVGCSTLSAAAEPRLHAGMLAMHICLCNRSQHSVPAVSGTL